LTLELLEWIQSPERLREILEDEQIAEKMKRASGKIVWIKRGDLIGE
jgi:TnpA family transposase